MQGSFYQASLWNSGAINNKKGCYRSPGESYFADEPHFRFDVNIILKDGNVK
jgi:hypothetical protein